MHRFPIGRAVGTAALACGLVLVPTAAATAETDDPRISPEQLSAMRSAFGLSEAGVLDLLEAQDEATELETTLRDDLAEDFGGAVFDIDTFDLTVQVTDRAAFDDVRAAGAVPELVEHGEAELGEAVKALDSVADEASTAVHGWYADPESDSVVIETDPGATSEAEALIEEAGVDADTVTFEEGTERPRTFADIVGGNPYHYQKDGGWYLCSVGFGVEGGYVTAGHCGDAGSATWQDMPGTQRIGEVAESVFPDQDSAWVRTRAGFDPTPTVNDYDGGTVTVTGSEEAPVGASVCRSGQGTGWHCGTIQAKDQTARYTQGAVSGLTRTSACAEGGDSGGSWLSGTEAQGVTSGGSGNCTTGGTTYFQPINPILDQWNLTLLTG